VSGGLRHLRAMLLRPHSMLANLQALSLWSFISGVLWGVSGGVGIMAWLLIKLLRFQRGEVSRETALRLNTRHHRRTGCSNPDCTIHMHQAACQPCPHCSAL
jgi:hypothetical protein